MQMDRPVSPGKDPESRDLVNRHTGSADGGNTCNHCRRIARYATALGVALNLPDETLVALNRASQIHGRGTLTAITPSPYERGYAGGKSATTGIPLIVQIVSLVDRFDGLTVAGPTRPAWSTEDACEILLHEAARGSRSTPLVEEFVALARSRRLSHLRQDPSVN
jgi:response regulator RpfG family c-di-GMP phosphodiesterase